MRINQLDPFKNTHGPPIGGPYLPIATATAYYLLQLQLPITYYLLQLQLPLMQRQLISRNFT